MKKNFIAKYNEEEENRAQQEFKISQLETMEQRWKALHDEDLSEPSSYYSSSYSSWLNYGSSFINNVLINIHLKISSLHIRYEDDSTIPGCSFAAGFIVESLTICSTDDQWQTKFVTRNNPNDNFLFKLIDLESLSCYFDVDTKLFGRLDFQIMVDYMRKTLRKNFTRKDVEIEHGYLIAPVNGKCFLKRNCSEMSLISCQQPRTVIDVQLERVPIMMTAIQYKHILDWSIAFQTQKTLWKYRKWRPMIQKRKREKREQSIENDLSFNDDRVIPSNEFNTKIWWHFAINANLEDYRQRKQRFNWHFILNRCRNLIAYQRAYIHYLLYPESLSKEMQLIKDRVENELTLDELCSIREIAFFKADKILRGQQNSVDFNSSRMETAIENPSSSSYWLIPYNIWSSFYSTNSNNNNNNEEEVSKTLNRTDSNQSMESAAMKASKNQSTSSISTLKNIEEIFFTRDAIYCQFNFQIHNSSFQLIALSSDEQNQQMDSTFILSSFSFYDKNQGNLLLDFEFNELRIGVDITNPNAYSCDCHRRDRRIDNTILPESIQIDPKQSKISLSQTQLNQFQLDLKFECQNSNLSLLRTDEAIISENDMQKLATAQLSGCGIALCFNNDLIRIDGRMVSFELIDLITSPDINKHKRILSIGKAMDSNHESDVFQNEKALSFYLQRQMNENFLRVNIEMASFCYVHSALFVYELSLCQKCFTDVLEAHFSRAFKDRVKAATNEMIRGIVPGDYSGSETSSSPSLREPRCKSPRKNSPQIVASLNNRRKPSAKSSHSNNSFIDRFRINVFIRSPVIVCPISPRSFEVVVFHLGHMSLNNHESITDHSALSSVRTRQKRKFAIGSNPLSTTPPLPPSQSQHNQSYSAEIRDLSVYSLDCNKNLNQINDRINGNISLLETIPIEEFYNCDTHGVPILQKTIIEIVIERKVLLFSTFKAKKTENPLKSTSTVSSNVDGLNLISSVNSIDPLLVPKKFSIRQHLCPNLPAFSASERLQPSNKPEMVLSIEISAIEVRFSYTDLLVFMHILNNLASIPATNLNHTTVENQKDSDEMFEMIQQISLTNLNLDAEEFRSRLNKLIDLGFDARQSFQALVLKNGDIIEAAYMLSNSDEPNHSRSPDWIDVYSDQMSDDNLSQCTSTSTIDGISGTTLSGNSVNTKNRNKNGQKSRKSRQKSNLFLSFLSVIELKVSNGYIKIIDDCNQLDLPLLEFGITDFRLMQYYSLPTVEAHAQTNFYCDYYNPRLSGWETFIENCQLAFFWKRHEPRCYLKSMLNTVSIAATNRISVTKQKLAIKVNIINELNLNISRAMLDSVEKVHQTWTRDIEHFMSLPSDQRAFRHRRPFIPFAIRNQSGNNIQIFNCDHKKKFTTVIGSDSKTLCDEMPMLYIQEDIVYFDCVNDSKCAKELSFDRNRNLKSSADINTSTPLKIYAKIDGWNETFPLSIEREGTFVRPIVSERFANHPAILVFEIELQSNGIKMITVRSSLLITNRTTKTVELKFVNTALSDVRTLYSIEPDHIFPVPLDLLYARIQLRPHGLDIGPCSAYINWNHVKKIGQLDCALQICTPIRKNQKGSESDSPNYVVSVLVERNPIGALIESRKIYKNGPMKLSSLTTLPSHTITLLPPIQLANRLPCEIRFKISNLNQSSRNQSSAAATIKAGEDYSIHQVSPLDPFGIEFQMEHFPRCRMLYIEPGAIQNYQLHIEMYDAKNRLLVLNAHITVLSACLKPSNAMTITIFAPYWIINRSGLPLIFAQESGSSSFEEAAGQYEEHERARSISPLLFSYSDPDSPQYCIMRLGKMFDRISPRWCNLFCLEKGTFYRRLRATEYASDSSRKISKDKIYEFGIDIRQGRGRYSQTKIVTIAPRYQIENLTSFKLEFAQKCLIDQQSHTTDLNNGFSNDSLLNHSKSFTPSYMSSPIKSSRSRQESLDNHNETKENLIVSALPKSNMPFHWPCTDREKLLCVRISSFKGCFWSGSFEAGSDPSTSFHLNIRDDNGHSNFIRVEILLQNATYFIVFTDANNLPPPIKIENFSQVAIEFYQIGSLHRTIVRPNSSMPYALDEPTKPPNISVCAPGGSTWIYDLNSFAPDKTLLYDNFYYLAFEETFTYEQFDANYVENDEDAEQLMYMMMAGQDFSFWDNDIGAKMLVLDVAETNLLASNSEEEPKPVFLGRKERGKRSQLWRLDPSNHLIHEGSSPPYESSDFQDLGMAEVKFAASAKHKTLMVLDVLDDEEQVCDQSLQSVTIPLVIRKLNEARLSTQSWYFTEDGRLRCLKYRNMFVQPLPTKSTSNDIFQNGSIAVISFGPSESTVTKATIPKEQAILKQKMRKGSGVLNISILADGPSRVLRIKDNQMTANSRQLQVIQNHSIVRNEFGEIMADNQSETTSQSFLMHMLAKTELELNLKIDSIGLSIISRHNEELIFSFMKQIHLDLICNPAECRLNCSIENFQIDNQLLDCEKEVVLYTTNFELENSQNQSSSRALTVPNLNGNSANQRPAITFNAHKLFIPNVEINVFKSLQININDLVMNIEELLLLKLLDFISYEPVDLEIDAISSNSSSSNAQTLLYHTSGNSVTSSLARSMQYFFAYLFIQLKQVKLSVFTSSSILGKYLIELKKKSGIKLIRFEEALIQLKPFHKVYSLMTRQFLRDSIHEHYRSELRSQAAKILGTVDFLGNPVGFINNVIEGFNEFYYEHSLRGLIMNVTHGISDSTAKVTSALSESLGFVTMDDRHQEIRHKIKQQSGGMGGQRSHLVVGAFGLAHGILGGITSVITQTYDGIVNHGGVTGFLSGLSRGVLGTFTKPAVGMLDFASGAATAVRDSSKKAYMGMNERKVKRVRLPRTLTIDGRLTRYKYQQSQWQSRFYNTTDFGHQREYGEQFVHVFTLSERHFVLLTTERLFFFHAPIKKCQLPSDDITSNRNDNERIQSNDFFLANCTIMKLQILPLEQLKECRHHRMMFQDGQNFLQTHSACSDLTTIIGTVEEQSLADGQHHRPQVICDFIEFSIYDSSDQNQSNSIMSEERILNSSKQSFQYPRSLLPCYFYSDSSATIQSMIESINEAKHLQEERKFEISNLALNRF
ncbi:DUF1162 domain containing protein [Sarcoptes scabiei]|uniref:DUF1162 domain containing protein n=1 Tax=Sarcoptes scabiei TaxID=52283 RepID=A0A132ADN6_SARSC|nr:DUF1162 domain containing protein [Sarcoptes scabiei]